MYVSNEMNNTLISGSSGSDTMYNDGSYVTMDGGAGDDHMVSWDTYSSTDISYVTILGGDGNDSVIAFGKLTYIEGGVGDDSLYTSGDNSTVIAGDGNDVIDSFGAYSIIYGNDGNDSIRTRNRGDNSTIVGGKGNDTITLESGSNNNVILYYSGDGNDIVYGFDGDDTLKISGASYSTTTSGSDVIVDVPFSYSVDRTSGATTSITHGKITLVGAASNSLNIESDSSVAPTLNPDVPTPPSPTISANAYVYSGGNVTLSATESYYSSVKGGYTTYDQVNFTTDLLSFGISGDNISINSSSGTLKLSNTRGKYMNYADGNGNPFAYSYIGVNGISSNTSVGNGYSSVENSYANAGNVTVNNSYNTINDKSRTVYGVVIGGDNLNDSIIAGSGGSSLWGGNGGNDTLVGGTGVDEFVYKLGNGNDVIQNASSSDFVNLEGIKLSQITSIDTSAGAVTAQFSDNGSIRIEGTESVGIKVDGWTVAYDHSGGGWQVK